MIVYHGTDIASAYSIKEGISLDTGSKNVDFGPGFYVTADIELAKRWASRKATLRNSEFPVVVIFEFDDEGAKPIIENLKNDLNWGRFIVNNRNGYEYIRKMSYQNHNLDAKYPIVYGRIADREIIPLAERLKEYNEELSSIDEILNSFYPTQYSFHTKEGLKYLSIDNKFYDVSKGGMRLW